jgi:hypothetical protein
MVEEAEKYAEEDKANRERIESRNKLENYAYSLKNQVNDDEGLGGKMRTRRPSRTPSRRPRTGSRRTPPPPSLRTSMSSSRSCLTSLIPSPPSFTAELVALARRSLTTMSCKWSTEQK